MTKKTKIIAASIISIGLATAGFGAVKAASNPQGPMNGLVQAIAKKFNLNASDVQQVLDQQRSQMETERQAERAKTDAQRQQEFTDKIKQAVTGGKLTQAQADLIIAKKAELEVQKTSLEEKTREERQTIMKQQMDSLKKWISDNNIPQEYCPFVGFGMGKGFGKLGGHNSNAPGVPNGKASAN